MAAFVSKTEKFESLLLQKNYMSAEFYGGYDMEALFEAKELKVIYRLLHKNLLQEPSLMDSEFLQNLQTYLQKKSRAEGVDVSNHSAWDAWLRA